MSAGLGPVRLGEELERRRRAGLYRARRVLGSPQGPEPVVDGRSMLAFCSNDYLGLANHPQVVAALRRGAAQYGAGSGAAHLISGHSAAHHALEEELAEFLGRPRALLFSTGYMANLGVISALVGRADRVYEDRLNHASLLAGSLLSTDGVFRMDGDLAPLPQLAEAAGRHGAWLLVDDAHGLGVLGEEGRGSLDHFGLGLAAVPVLVGTLGKSFGTFGAFVAGTEELIETLIQRARSYV